MQLTEVSEYKNHKVSGYMLNVGLSKENQQIIAAINEKIKSTFGDVILNQPGNALHITLMDWVTPLTKYEEDWDGLFARLYPLYDETFSKLVEDVSPFTIVFDTIKVSPAAIFIQGHDNGQFQRLRNTFAQEIQLVAGTKPAPKIVHCTIARFDQEIELQAIEEYVASLSINFDQQIDTFRLVNEIDMPMLSYEVIKNYELS